MDETSFNNYTSLDPSKKDSDAYITIECGKSKQVSNLISRHNRSGYRFFIMTVAWKLAIVAAIIFVGCGNFVYLSASGTREVKYVIPDGYILLPKQETDHTSTSRINATEASLTKETERIKASQEMLNVTQTTATKEIMTTSTPVLGCEVGWIELGSSCYYFSKDGKTWQNAFNKCLELGGYLVEITSPTENEALVMKAREHGGTHWIGMSDKDKEGTWVWTSSKTIATYTNWYPGEPNNILDAYGVDEDCCEITGYFNFFWNDETCSFLRRYICEKTIR